MRTTNRVSETDIPELALIHRGKVRDVYELDENRLLLVATDRISAFDCVLPTLIDRKGEVLTQISRFWFDWLESITPNHLISVSPADFPQSISNRAELAGRSTIVRRTEVFPVECVVRGYLEGSGWQEYKTTGSVCGHVLPAGLRQCDQLPEPLFTPATKAASGHDENIDLAKFTTIVGEETAEYLRDVSLSIYNRAAAYAASRGIIIADTKFEFGTDSAGNTLLIDEVLTPDSSRFWEAESYAPGTSQASFDKQFVREYLETLDWDKSPPAPPLPYDVSSATTARYLQAFEMLTGQTL